MEEENIEDRGPVDGVQEDGEPDPASKPGENGAEEEPVTAGNGTSANGDANEDANGAEDGEELIGDKSDRKDEPPTDQLDIDQEGDARIDAEGEGRIDAEGEGRDSYKRRDDDEKPETEGEGEPRVEDTYEKAAKDNRCLWMINKLEEFLDDFKFDEMWKPEYYTWLLDFLNPKLDLAKLYAWVSLKDRDILFTNSGNPSIEGNIEQFQMIYFIKLKFDEPITLQNIHTCVHVDSVEGDSLDDLLNKMNNEYLNQFLQDKTWPDGVRKDFIAGLHKFMAALTEASHISKGRTTLYIPSEDLSDIEAAAKDKDLLQRLESTVIFWTRQIKEVVSNQESQQSNEHLSSPLDEIDHWTTRTNNLDVLYKQLQKPELKKICAVLRAAESSYLTSFKDLEAKIEEGSLEAADNLKYLKTLADPCRKIENSEPKDIPGLLPEVLNCVRLIWEMSTHYWSEERMKGLLTKISNQIIKRCRAKINVNDMLNGDVDKCMKDLDESINCCNEWKRICTRAQRMIIKYGTKTSGRQWKLASDDTIFAENEAFIQRCKDCKDICEGQLQFARKGQGISLPKFGGSKGPEIRKNLDELQAMFHKYLEDIKDLDYDILDVKKTKWHDDYGQKFKENQKSLEIMYRNTALHAFKNITTVAEGVEMLENFHQLAKRQLVKEYINTKAAEHVYRLFMDEMKEVEEMYENYTKAYPPMAPSMPKFAGLAIWALSLMIRIDKAKKEIDTLFFIPHHPSKDEALEKYRKLKDALDSFITIQFEDNWNRELYEKLDLNNLDDKLKTPLLVRSENVRENALPDSVRNNPIFTKSKDSDFLESNFDKTLLKTLSEGTYWTKLQNLGMVTVNHAITKLLAQKEALRTMRENVMIIVREYNKIIDSVNSEQKKLFKEHLRDLDGVIESGMTRFKWNSQANSFLMNSRMKCLEIFNKVKKFQKNEKIIKKEYEQMGRTTLTEIGKELYGLHKFLTEQEQELKKNEGKFSLAFDRICKYLIDTYEIFIFQQPEIQSYFLAYVNKLDEEILNSLKSSVKNTLMDLSKHVRGENKKSDDAQAFVPIFRVYTCIDPKERHMKIIHDPSAQELREGIEKFIGKINSVTKAIPRLGKVFREKREDYLENMKNDLLQDESSGSKSNKNQGRQAGAKYPALFDDFKDPNLSRDEKIERWDTAWKLHEPYQERSPYYEKISRSKGIQDKTTGILESVENIQTIFYEDAQYWMRNDFKQIYNMGKGIKRVTGFKNTSDDDPLDTYKFYIETVIENIGQVRKESVQKPQLFIQFDNSKLIDTFLEIGYEHINEIYRLIVDEARGELDSLYNTFDSVSRQLNSDTEDLKVLKEKQELYEKTMAEKDQLKGRIEPIQKKFDYLKGKSQEHQLTEAEHNRLRTIYEAWDNFEKSLHDGKQMLSRIQKKLKQGVDEDIEDFRKAVEDNKKQFLENAPYSCDKVENTEAKEKIREHKKQTTELREREEEMKFGLDIFHIDHPVYPELSLVEKDCQLLEQIWSIKEQWDSRWEEWKDIKFDQIDSNAMNDEAQEFSDKLKSVDREIRNWGIYDYLKNKIESFLQTMPLIGELRNEAIRERHWKQLRIEVSNDFDEKADDFTLEKVFELQLNQHNEFIQELCTNASKELRIENQLDMIEYTWEQDPKTDLILKKETSKGNGEEYYKVVTAENIYAVIEDHVVILSNNKSGAFYKQFEERIDLWEENLAKISETLELLMVVQSKWGYLESIFSGQADIMKQLSQEHTVFQNINKAFRSELERINKDRNAKKALLVDKFMGDLEEMDDKLEHIQKNLDDYLKLKRQNFPRFFFLSNEDLLEIMGQSKDPTPMNKHVKKCFEGIQFLTISKGNNKGKTHQITSLVAPDGEEVALTAPISGCDKVEDWFQKLLETMQAEVRAFFKENKNELRDALKRNANPDKLGNAIKTSKGQYLITSCQIDWTNEVTATLTSIEQSGNTAGYKKLKSNFKNKVDKYTNFVKKLTDDTRSRNKLVALITIEQHNKDIVDSLARKNIQSPKHFEWEQQLKVTKEENPTNLNEPPTIIIKQTNCRFEYGYEYQGNNGRLVVTPLTDRAYMTLTNALNMCRGGAPQGPAGTGKTETVKDLGKNLAYFVVVQNCSDSLDFQSLGKMFEGLASAGVWGCFDEFNRIEIEVLSVVAQQISTILDAIKRKAKTTIFEDSEIPVKHTCGIFITMNPGYAGRTELPDNLKSLFRPVAMMVPGFIIIAKIILMSEGFEEADELSVKVCKMYDLMRRQLSKQDHYDFGMRAVKSVLSTAGRIKRQKQDQDEFTIMIKAIRDMNLPKFVAEDVVLFDNLFLDLFPNHEEPFYENDDLLLAIEDALTARKLQINANLAVKIVQLYESKITRHGNMLVGKTLSGKTTVTDVLHDACNLLADQMQNEEKFPKVLKEIINPKSISINELFGYFDGQVPPQWHDGILSTVLKRMCQDTRKVNHWLILDGPVDTLWIESMNSVLDDNKVLTLNNGDRIALTDRVRLLFEVENLAMASLATVSRAGMIYVDIDDLGWKPIIEVWIEQKEDKELRDLLEELIAKYLNKVLQVKKLQCKELVPTSETACVRCFCQLFDNQVLNFPKLPEEDFDSWRILMEKLFVYCLIWSVGATVEERSRKDIDYVLRDIESIFPHQNTIYEHYLNVEKRDWASWEERIPAVYKPQEKDLEFHIISVPTVDTARNKYLVQSLLKHGSQVLLVGHTGVGKTALIDGILISLDISVSSFSINFSAGTTSESTQTLIESNFERRTKSKYNPKNAKKKAICFVDDLNMPRKDTFGSQPPLELIRQWMDYSSWYNREKLSLNTIVGLQFLCAMGKPGGGRAEISQRLMSKYHVINYTIPDDSQMKRIYESIAAYKLQGFEEEVKNLVEPMAVSTINLFSIISEKFLPTPAKSHYVFNMRDISKVFQGLYRADKGFHDTKEQIVQLWAHEVLRVFQDRLVSQEDINELRGYLDEQMETHFQMSFSEFCQKNGEDAVYVDFLNESKRVYEEVQDREKLRSYLVQQLEKYNEDPKLPKMDLVLFRDAIYHIARVYRVISLKRGHAFLVGVGGSGRHSVTRLASYINGMTVFEVQVTKGFGVKEFRDFLKTMYEHAGFRGKRKKESVFIFSENDIVMEQFLEDVNNMLSSGMVPNLFNNEELGKIREEIRPEYKKEGNTLETNDAINEFFFSRVKDNLHIALCMSPLGRAFKDYCKMYPALINNTTIDWFMKWPKDALIEVAKKYINALSVPEEHKPSLAQLCCHVHATVGENSEAMLKELKRVYHVTPTNYIDLLKSYEKILVQKRKEIGDQITKLRNGLDKLDDARKQVEEMTVQSEAKRAEVSKEQKEAEDLMVQMSQQQNEADDKLKVIEAAREKIGKEKLETEKMAADAESELKKAEPALIAAEESLEKLDKKYIAEIKSFPSPPPEVEMVMYAVMVILEKETTWMAVKKELADPKFVKNIKEFNKDSISSTILKKIEKYTKKSEFDPDYIKGKSEAAGALCLWVRSMEDYAKALKVVGPKRQKKQYAEEQLAKKIEALQALEDEFKLVNEKLMELKLTLDQTNKKMDALKKELENLQFKIDTGEKLVSNLSGEKERWEASLRDYDIQFEKLTGDCLISASVISYYGPFTSEYRRELMSLWVNNIQALKIPHTQDLDFADFLVGRAVVRDWNIKGLPTDEFSVENGVMAKKSNRWPLMIDPQSQGLEWTQNMEKKIKVADIKDPKYLNVIEKAVSHGQVVIMPDVGEEIDPTLYPLLEKAVFKVLGRWMIKIGSKDVEYNDKFKLFITTRMSNPHYTPDVSTRVCLINFTVKESGLEEQLLAKVVELEQPNLEKSKSEQVQKIARSKKKLIELEDQILSMLSNSKVSLIEDIELVKTLETSKNTADEAQQSLESSEQTMKKIDEAREAFRPCGRQASILFFVLSDLNKIDPMYQFSLSWYKKLFCESIETSRENPFQDRIVNITKEHTLSVYKNACMSLFERHKLLLSLQMCVKLKMAEGDIDEEDWSFFLRGGNVMDRSDQPPKPNQDWITTTAWDNITELEKQMPEVFTGLTTSITHSPKEWHRWYMAARPEQAPLPAEWETKCEEKLKKMIILRCLRPDRIIFACMDFVESKMKKDFVESRPVRLEEVYKNTDNRDPIIFVLSPGVDPIDQISNLAITYEATIQTLALGKGQNEKARKLLQDGLKSEKWIYLANCHLSISMLPTIESEIDNIKKQSSVPEKFRIFMSSNPHPKFPVSLLQSSIKITSEPPKGVRSNMMRMYSMMTEFQKTTKPEWYRKAMFGLCWFHAVVIERHKFKSLGWNTSYSFNDSDFSVCEDLLRNYMQGGKDETINWKAIQYLIAEANYGGRVTDDWDRRLIIVYAEEIFNEKLVLEQRWKPPGTDTLNYQYINEEELKGQQGIGESPYTPQYFMEDIAKNMEVTDNPIAFGQHINAEITSQIMDANSLLNDILSLQPQKIEGEGMSQEESVLQMIADLKENIPKRVSLAEVKHKHKKDESPIKIVLIQEIQRYNGLLVMLEKQLDQLEKGIKGFVVISPELELVMHSLSESKVPESWRFLYFSLKPLAAWIRDLDARYTHFSDWAFKAMPSVFWISAFTYPTGFTTALLQKYSRKPSNQIPIDQLEFEYLIEPRPINEIYEPPREGAYTHGLFLEGARWEPGEDHLQEPRPMELYCAMPIIQFKPMARKSKVADADNIYTRKGDYYKCPTYYYPIRSGTINRDSYITVIDLKIGPNHTQEFWIKRGTALLMSLAD